MAYRNFEIYHVGQGDGDFLDSFSVSEDLFDKHKNEDNNLAIGGAYNGQYLLFQREIIENDEFVGHDDTVNESGIDSIVELVEKIQELMDFDKGSYISTRFLQRLKDDEYEQIVLILKYPIQDYAGGQIQDPRPEQP